jgi:hypothetical protein
MDGVIRVAIAKLRNLSNEFKEARRIPAAERKEVVSGLAKRASETLVRCWDCGYLRSILSLNQRLEELEAIGCASSHSFGGVVFRLFLFDHLVGYFDAIFEEIDEPYTYINDEGEVIETEVTNQYCYLNIGMLAQDGLLDTPPIFIGQGSVTEKEIQRAKIENSFEVLGYYSLGCEVLVEILEREVALESDDRTVVDARRPEDGLYADERCLIWDGERYERLTRKMVEILEVFVDQFNRGFPVVNLDLIFRRTGKRFDGGFIGQAFKQNRKGSPPLHDVHAVLEKISDGEYRLLPPSENNS